MGRIKLQDLTLILFLLLVGPIKAQVTIGSGIEPVDGALLDLKEQDNTSGGITATKGLALPRVELKKLTPADGIELATSIGSTGNWDVDEHIGLTIYNMHEDVCLSTPILKGIYVWDGTEWQFLGKREEVSPDVGYYEDTRPHGGALAGTTQRYPYRTFGTAGTWMLENMRYIPTDGSITAKAGDTAYDPDNKFYTYPQVNGVIAPDDAGTKPATWSEILGLLYSYSAATLGAQDGVDIDQGQGSGNATPVIQGICPPTWHIPSDEEWNELQKEIYNKPYDYSTYTNTASDVFAPPTWDPTWETGGLGTAGWDARGSSNGNGHGLAMQSPCKVPGFPYDISGKSLSTAQGGFNVFRTGRAYGGSTAVYGMRAGFWSASSQQRNGAWMVYFERGEATVGRFATFRHYLFSVRCKKDE